MTQAFESIAALETDGFQQKIHQMGECYRR
jgi:hypothetical protein